MTETHERVLGLFLEGGLQGLADVLGVGMTEAHRKIKGETGFTLRQLSDVLDARQVRFAAPGDVIVDAGDYEAMVRLVNKWSSERVATFEGSERRRPPMRLVPAESKE